MSKLNNFSVPPPLLSKKPTLQILIEYSSKKNTPTQKYHEAYNMLIDNHPQHAKSIYKIITASKYVPVTPTNPTVSHIAYISIP